MRQAYWLGMLLVALAASSCRSADRAWLVADPAMVEVVGGPPALSAMGKAARRRLGLDLRVLTARDDKAMEGAMGQALADAGCRIVLGLSTSTVDAAAVARSRPDVLFAFYGERGAERPANLLLLLAERPAAFREAGRRIGRLVGATEAPGAAGPPPRVAILAASPSVGAAEEIAAFRAGLEDTAPGTQPLYRELRSQTDKAGATRLLKELRAEGARFFLLKTYGLTGGCLEDLARDGGRAVTEDCGGSAACGKAVLYSVETDWPGTFGAILELVAPGAPGAWGWKGTELGEVWRIDEHGSAGRGS